MKTSNVIIIDVREPEEFNTGHVEGFEYSAFGIAGWYGAVKRYPQGLKDCRVL